MTQAKAKARRGPHNQSGLNWILELIAVKIY